MASVYRTARGKAIDMHKLVKQNEMAVAVGNAKVNARGDKLGPGGRILQRREEIVSQNAGAIPDQISVPEVQPEPVVVAPVVKAQPKDISNQDPEGNE
jgi:hypothetical protein